MPLKIRILTFTFLILFSTLIIRLFYWQIIKGKGLSEDAKNQYTSSKVVLAPRGNILATDGSFWVVRNQTWLVWANPKLLSVSPEEAANKLAPLFLEKGSDREVLMQEVLKLTGLLGKANTSWVAIKQKVDENTKRNVEALNIKGIGFDSQASSFYPEASSAAQILGFVGKDESGTDVGYFGLEGYYDLPLSGKPGFVGGQKDALGSPILLDGTTQVTAISGVDLKTNIDKRIQTVVENELAIGIEKYGAVGGSVTIMDPFTGKVMAMASFPSFDPNKY